MYEEKVYKNLPLCTELFLSAKHRKPLNKIFAIVSCVFVHTEKLNNSCVRLCSVLQSSQTISHELSMSFTWPS